ncbi:hypothetical protein [Corallococcus aberystwythensis]|uniref:Uncharacterized protein n=1 Tax=Corallococcus aberystwythensis TaxID=2316722 RepID=A0A3A8QBW2_9BACT|nr:hypothetical protein [Corallococcus aberystwythensis]RKH63745.1 hypothetical protein D7W81_19775 [Corallococcus aberystwythensis]
MRTVLKSLLASASLLALVPLPAAAVKCQVACSCTTPCDFRCTVGASTITCGDEQLCIDYCRAPSEQQASVSEEMEASGDTAPVCEEPQASESTAES